MKHILYIFAVICSLAVFVGCEETDDTVNEFDNWAPRNETFMRDTLALANRQVQAAKRQWGDAWEEHCDWRVYPSYCVTTGGKTTWEDSIAVRVVEHGKGNGCPLYTDSVRVTYAGRLIPSVSYPAGYLFDRSGMSNKIEEIMDSRFAVSTSFKVSNLVEGFTTALMHMHNGDYWRVFIPSNMGYGTGGSDKIPGSSTLVFDMRLNAYYRQGAIKGEWH